MPTLARVPIKTINKNNPRVNAESSEPDRPISRIANARKRGSSARANATKTSNNKTAQEDGDDEDDPRSDIVASAHASPAKPTDALRICKNDAVTSPTKRRKIQNNIPGNGWDVGTVLKGTKTKTCWISPTRKMKFKYHKDAVLFESLRQKFGPDEVQAWLEYTKMKYSLKQSREVIHVRQYDDDIDLSKIKRDNKKDFPGPGWDVGYFSTRNTRRVCWISPTRKIKFKYRQDAALFESMRKKFGSEEIQAWVQYTKMKHSLKQRREVLDARRYDHDLDVSLVRKNSEEDTPGPGWEFGSFSKHNRRRVFWMSPTRKIKFRYRQDAVLFEALRKKFGSDEVQAWVEYTRTKQSLNLRREVIDPCQYDCNVGSGNWTKEEHRVFLRGIDTYGRDYVKIASLISTRSREQVKRHAFHHFKNIADSSSNENQGSPFHQLGNDILYNIASFFPTAQSLVTFCFTSKRVNTILGNPFVSEKLYRCYYVNMFGRESCEGGDFGSDRTWKERWANVYSVKRGWQALTRTTLKSSCAAIESSVGVLRRQVEEEALYQDNPEFTPHDRDNLSPGYFGIHALTNLPPPPNANIDWAPPIILNGDFNGVKVFDSLQDFTSTKKENFLSIGDENDGQVLSLVLCQWNPQTSNTHNPPCCFLGHASGCVAALTATLSSDGDDYVYSIERQHHAHNCEVTALTIVDCTTTDGRPGPILFSACHGGRVCYYPHAMNPIQNFNMKSFPAFSNSRPIFSMTSTAIAKGNDSTILICTGDSDGAIWLWSASSGLLGTCHADNVAFHQIQRFETRGKHLVTAMKFIQRNVLVSCCNQGDIRVWDLHCTNSAVSNSDQVLPSLQLRRHLKSAHNGSVEMCMNVGDILLTSGGNDGNIAGWDTMTWEKIGALCCHQGKDAVHPTTRTRDVIKSCVVGAILTRKDNRLVSLCRDGVIFDWIYEW